MSILPNSKVDVSKYFKNKNSLMFCLEPLLGGLGWYGSSRSIIESLPHFANSLSKTKFFEILNRFGFEKKAAVIVKYDIDLQLLPCLMINDSNASVVLEKRKDGYWIYNGDTKTNELVKKISGTAYIFSNDLPSSSTKYIQFEVAKFKKAIYQIIMISFFLNLFVLFMPIFVMTVYDQVILSGSLLFLSKIALGMLFIIISSFILNKYQNKLISFISTKLNNIISNKIFNKLISLELSKINSVSLGVQISKLKEFDVVKDFCSKPIIQSIVNAPFVLMILLVMYIIAGNIILVTIISILLLFISSLFIKPKIREVNKKTSLLIANRQSFLVESIHNLEQIRLSSAEKSWIDRYRKLSAQVAMSNFRTSLLNMFMNFFSDAIITLTALATIVMGVFQVMSGSLSVGGLIAVMMLVWRVLTPLKAIEASIPNLVQLATVIKRINNLVNIPAEVISHRNKIFSTTIKGDIKFNRIIFRYQGAFKPLLLGASCKIKAGQLVIIGGHNGEGKSTLFKLLSKMYKPLAGDISIDNKNIMQIDTTELRQLISYVSQKTQFFYGTLLQNLLLAAPEATNKDIDKVLKSVDLYDDVMSLPNGINTRFEDDVDRKYSASFLQRFLLARALIKKPKILLLDDPFQHIDQKYEDQIMSTLLSLKGKVTILMISHRPSHFKLADVSFKLENGLLSKI